MNTRQLLVMPAFIAVLGATSALPVYAQNTGTTTNTDRTVTRVENDRGIDWGWLGLLGLAGLMGLKRRDDKHDYTARPATR